MSASARTQLNPDSSNWHSLAFARPQSPPIWLSRFQLFLLRFAGAFTSHTTPQLAEPKEEIFSDSPSQTATQGVDYGSERYSSRNQSGKQLLSVQRLFSTTSMTENERRTRKSFICLRRHIFRQLQGNAVIFWVLLLRTKKATFQAGSASFVFPNAQITVSQSI